MATRTGDDFATAAENLLDDVLADPWGRVLPSPYETGHLVAIAPWLAGHAARLKFLRRVQNPDGSWGGPDGYALVPTLSATIAMLTELARRDQDPAGQQDAALLRAARIGLRAVRRMLEPGRRLEIPDTVAVEVILPGLLAELRGRLPESAWDGLSLPDHFDRGPLDTLQSRLAAGAPLPAPAHHFLEMFGPVATRAESARPACGIGASPAATAAWLGGPDGPPAGRRFLERLQEQDHGPVPNVTPITCFETAWVLNSLAVGRLAYEVPLELLTRLESGLTEAGASAGAGLPPDADDTAAVLSALLRHGRDPSPEPLLGYWAGDHFRSFADERNPSVSGNAHVLEALSLFLAAGRDPLPELSGLADSTAQWLCDRQQPDGSWWDKWHASPYYATYCCVLALTLHRGPAGRAAIDRAVAWVRGTQRSDGSWGRWGGTVEETAYGMHVLALTGVGDGGIRRGSAFLADPRPLTEDTPLWHGKDLYIPVRVVRAAHLAARHLGAGLDLAGGRMARAEAAA